MELKDATDVTVHLYNQDVQGYYWSYSLSEGSGVKVTCLALPITSIHPLKNEVSWMRTKLIFYPV